MLGGRPLSRHGRATSPPSRDAKEVYRMLIALHWPVTILLFYVVQYAHEQN